MTTCWDLRLLRNRRLMIETPRHPVTGPPTNQKKVMYPVDLTPNSTLKTRRYYGSFEHELPVLLALPLQ